MRRSWSHLRIRADFLRVAAAGQRRVTPAFILQAAPIAAGEKGRVGFTVTRKVGNAVIRNRARRRLRAAADQVLTPEKMTHDLVLIGRNETITRDFAAMVQDLRNAVDRIGASVASKKSPRAKD